MELSPLPVSGATGTSQLGRRRAFFGAVRGERATEQRRCQKGGANVKAIVWTVILVACVYGAVMVLPVLINEYQFQDSLQEIARFASVNRKNEDQIRAAVLEEAQKEDLPVQAQDIKVEGHSGNVHINVDYSVTVDLKVYQWTFNFHPTANNASLL